MIKKCGLQMLWWIREPKIAQHEFYVSQARTRLLLQFEDMEAEAGSAGEEWLEVNGRHFNPDRDDPGDFYERAHDITIGFYQSLSDLHEQTRLSIVAGMFHQWDKELRDWMVAEIRHWGVPERFMDEIWASTFDDIFTLLAAFGWDTRGLSWYDNLDACRWLVNAYKHGEGRALNKLRSDHPHFLVQSYPQGIPGLPDIAYRRHSDLTVTEDGIEMFSNTILEFWRAVPELIDASHTLESCLPARFRKALQR